MRAIECLAALAVLLAAPMCGCGKSLPEGFTLAGRWESSEADGLGLNFDPQNAAGSVEVTVNKDGSVSLGVFRYVVHGGRSPFTLTLRREGPDPCTLGDITVTCVDAEHIQFSHTVNVADARLTERAVELHRPVR